MMEVKISISLSFLRSLNSLQGSIRKKVNEALEVFQLEPKSPGLNYESLHVAEKCFRSIRVDKDYRIILAKYDGGYHVLHVDKHDDAYNWARRKRFEHNKHTSAFQLFSIEEVVETTHSKEVDKTVSLPLEDIPDEQLLKIGIPDIWIKRVKLLKHEEELVELIEHLPEELIENLEHLFKGWDIRNIIAEVEEGTEKIADGTESTLNERRNYYLVTDEKELAKLLSGDFEKWRVFLHPSQTQMAFANNKGPAKVTGGAGTGKTVVAIHRAWHLAKKVNEHDKPILFTTFTKSLVNNLKKVLLTEEACSNKIQIENLHAFLVDFAVDNGLIVREFDFLSDINKERKSWVSFLSEWHPNLLEKAGFYYEENSQVIINHGLFTEETYLKFPRRGRQQALGRKERKYVWEVVKRYHVWQNKNKKYSFGDICYHSIAWLNENPKEKPFSHLICDEVQDFNNIELRYMRALVPEGSNDLFFVGDPLQNIYGKSLSFSGSDINIRGRRSKKLRLNYRTTEEIRQFAVERLKGETFSNFDDGQESPENYISLMRGTPPTKVLVSSKEDEKEYVKDLVQQAFGDSEISLEAICIAARIRKDVEKWQEFFEQHNIPCIILRDASELKMAKGRLVLATFHNLKGMEFKRVVLTGISEKTSPFKPWSFKKWDEKQQKLHIRSEKALLYVAMSRAVNTLVLTGVDANKQVNIFENTQNVPNYIKRA